MATKINARSPYYIKVSNASLNYATLNLYIYTGIFTTNKPVTAQYSITKTELGTNNYVVFEISELVRDYIEIEFDGNYNSQCVWVEADVTLYNSVGSSIGTSNTDYIALDGYGYFEEGVNPELSRGLLQSNKTIFRYDDTNVRVPIFTEDTNSVAFFYQGVEKRVQTVSTSTNTNGQIDYITVSGSDNNDTYKERVVDDGGTFEDSTCLANFLNKIDIGKVDEVWVNTDLGTDIIQIKTVNCSRYEPYKVTFVNKFGVLQDIWFFRKSTESMNVKSEEFKASIFSQDTLSYKTYQHQRQSYFVQGQDTISMNTGFLNDDYNQVIQELMLSEQVWLTKITDDEVILPIIPKTKSVTFKTSLNDRLANYTIEFDMAFDKINNIR